MKYLIISSHPCDESFHAVLRDTVIDALRDAGHSIDMCNLYAEKFDPVMTAEERYTYNDTNINFIHVEREVSRLKSAEGLVFVFPTWWYGMPAILKGYFDRVWLPGVAFEVIDGRTKPLLSHIKRYAVVTTYGSPWWLNRLVLGDPNRNVFMRCIRHLVSPDAKTIWLAQYGLDHNDRDGSRRFLERVYKTLRTF